MTVGMPSAGLTQRCSVSPRLLVQRSLKALNVPAGTVTSPQDSTWKSLRIFTLLPDGYKVTVFSAVHALPTCSGHWKSSGGSDDITGWPARSSDATRACVVGSCRLAPAWGAATATTGLPCQVPGRWVHTTWPSKLPRLPLLLRWKVLTVPIGDDAMPAAVGGAVAHPAIHSGAAAAMASNR